MDESSWDMTSFLHNVTYGRILDFSHLTTLYLHLSDDPNRNRMIEQLLALSANCLQSLRLYIWHNDGNVINLGDLSTLQFLTIVVNFSSMRECFQYLTGAIGTISVPKTHLTELRLVLDVDKWMAELAATVILGRQPSEVWSTLLVKHISRILRAWKDTCVLFEFPSQWHFLTQNIEAYNYMSNLLALDGMESSFRERVTVNIRENSVREEFMLRDSAEISIARVFEEVYSM